MPDVLTIVGLGHHGMGCSNESMTAFLAEKALFSVLFAVQDHLPEQYGQSHLLTGLLSDFTFSIAALKMEISSFSEYWRSAFKISSKLAVIMTTRGSYCCVLSFDETIVPAIVSNKQDSDPFSN